MSTRVSLFKGRLLSRVAFLGLALAVAGCSDSTSRFDNLFTASTGGPQRIDQGEFARRPVLPHADLSRQIPQRLDAPAQADPNANLFNARNVTRLSNQNGFRQSTQGYNFSSTPAPSPSYQRPVALSQSQPQSIARQNLPPVQSLPQQQTTFAAPQAGQRLTLAEAQAVNNRDVSAPLLARSAPRASQQALPQVPQASSQALAPRIETPARQSINVGTEWTNRYSPIPTQSPVPKVSALSSNGPRGYTPPQGVYTANVDSFPTSSIKRQSGPKIIKNTGFKTKSSRRSVDPIKVSSVQSSTRASENKTGWSSTGGTYVTVLQGETLYSISRRYGVPVKALSQANGIADASSVRAGQQILVPTYVYSPNAQVSAPDHKVPPVNKPTVQTVRSNAADFRQPLPPKPTIQAPLAGVYVVQKGDTLSSIARKNNVTLSELRNANGLYSTDVIRVGQKLTVHSTPQNTKTIVDPVITASTPKLPQTVSNRVVLTPRSRPHPPKRVVAVNTPNPSKRVGLPKIRPASQQVAKPSAVSKLPKLNQNGSVAAYTPPKVVEAPIKPQKQVAKNNTNFIWPVRGQIVSGFGSNTNGSSNDGIDLNVPVGTPVRAAASGEVIYASSGLTDYGKLVLIRHSDGYVSAYAHNSDLMVRRGQRVRQGQVVAKSGKTGSAKTPRVHFEIRNGKKPVDPLKYLPV